MTLIFTRAYKLTLENSLYGPVRGGCFSKNPNFGFIVFEVRGVVLRRRADAIGAAPLGSRNPRPEVAACGRWGFTPKKWFHRVRDWGSGFFALTFRDLDRTPPGGVLLDLEPVT